jgi:formate-dependent nitrite reductase membrane component NrfD
VEFDARICIGCKACMQACPYDAIYIDPETHTAAKCHFCAHRVELGLEPACVVVCPEHAIIAGDIDDPSAEISRMLAIHDVTVRKPEQGTAPKLFYIDGNDFALHPTATAHTPETFLWADVIPLHAAPARPGNGHAVAASAAAATKTALSGVAIRDPQPQGDPVRGPIQIGSGRMAEQMVQVSYNAQHQAPWHWPVPAYLVTKGIGAGIFMVLALAFGLAIASFDALTALVAGFTALLFVGATTALLVYDLDHPERFLSILLHPQWRSWLTRGAFLLVGFALVAGLWWLVEAAAHFGFVEPGLAAGWRPLFLWTGLALAIGVAVYTAFLFGQAEGRDLWQSSLLPFHLVVQAFTAGSGMLLVLDLVLPMPDALTRFTAILFLVALLVDLFVTLVGEFSMPHASDLAARAAHEISKGRYRRYFWQGSILLGHVAPLLLIAAGLYAPVLLPIAGALAGLCAVAGLYCYEYAFVMAPQELPNS